MSSIIPHFLKVYPAIGQRALLVVRRHLEVLAGPLVILSLAADRLDPEDREAMGRRLHELRDHWTPGAMRLEVADAPADLIQRDGDLGEGWYQVCCQLDLYRFVNKDSFLLLDLLGWCKDDLAIFLQPCNTWRESAKFNHFCVMVENLSLLIDNVER